ncbi:MAG: DUF6265 family protein [Vicinamibacterales bacterium]
MRVALILSLSAAVSISLAGRAAQPSLDATWVATKDVPPGLPAANSPLFGERFALTTTADTVTISRPIRNNTASLVSVHPANGQTTPVTVPGQPCFSDTVQPVTVTRTAAGFDYTSMSSGITVPYNFRLDGDTLIVESPRRNATGLHQFGTVYRRSTDALPPPLKGPNVTVAKATIADIGWLVGEWSGKAMGNVVEERWLNPAGGAMLGNSRTTLGASMLEFEFLCIAQRHGGLVYTAMPNGRGTTDFLLTKISSEGATFENPDHDFPKTIAYVKSGDDVTVTVSGAAGQRSFSYTFSKLPR